MVTEINDNITISYIPMKKLKTTSIGVYLHRPLSREEAAKNALLSYVLQRGCEKYQTTKDISMLLENLYGASFFTGVSKIGEGQMIAFNASTISDRYAPENERLISELMELILSVLFKPLTENGAFKESYVEQEKKTLKENIESIVNDKQAYAMMRCVEIMCKDENYGVRKLGYIEDVDKIDAKELYEHYKNIITSSRIDIFVAGDADIDALAADVKKYVEKIEFSSGVYTQTEVKGAAGEIKRETERMDVTQGKLSMGFRTGITPRDDKYWGLMVANSIFGGGAHCKLFNTVREKMSLAYYASSQLDKAKGVMFVNAGIEFENFDKAYNEIIRQLDLVKKGEVSDAEFNASKNAIINSLNSYYDSEGNIIMYYLTEQFLSSGNDIEYVKEQVAKVTIEDVKAAAAEIELDTVYFLAGKEDK